MSYYRIRVALPFVSGVDRINNGFTAPFYNRLDEQSDHFRSKLLLSLNSAIESKWSILFKPSPISEYDYLADIFTDDAKDVNTIINIIHAIMPEKLFHFKSKPFAALF